ncbi:excisionase family DNA-binding protein [Streptomyces sp. NBC_01306]|uniref:excisionase family DNA-binding protein n=1 Tax=Streptomyces sp. NBC_01306 TaxID=2903819 RepID=UPI002255BD7D|nr:helix-turn-helix domain-containing protein [Streptomyces sp. NBC_01306]MCX4725434.1 helix-turn-helix domain-containing protein [Streptomyces sp. NBC_01306]
MPTAPPPLTLIADALGVPEQRLRTLVLEHTTPSDAPLIALTVEEATRRLGVGRTTMYALIASGEVGSVLIGRLRRVPVEALDTYLADRSQVAAPTAAHAA